MFGDLAVLYLFLGGAGAGTIAVCSALDLALVRRPFGLASNDGLYLPGPNADPRARALDCSFALGFGMLAAGTICLLADLGRIDRVASIFLDPHPTVLTFGAYALAVLLALGAGLALVRFLYLPDIPQRAIRIAEAAAIPVSLAAMAYTGVLLQTLGGVAFWKTPLLPCLFVLSSLSCGTATVFAAAPFADFEDAKLADMLGKLARFDVAVIILEAIIAAAFLCQASVSSHPGTAASFEAITQGRNAAAWWIGFGLCGLAVPFVMELACFGVVRQNYRVRKILAAVAALVLIGALCMRWAVADSGEHRALELEETITTVHEDTLLE